MSTLLQVTKGDRQFVAILYPLERGYALTIKGQTRKYPTMCAALNHLMKFGYVKEIKLDKKSS